MGPVSQPGPYIVFPGGIYINVLYLKVAPELNNRISLAFQWFTYYCFQLSRFTISLYRWYGNFVNILTESHLCTFFFIFFHIINI